MKGTDSLEITFLGTGTSHGVPVIGCSCNVCTSKDLRNKRSRTALFVRTSKVQFVIDTPPDFRSQCLREHITQLDAVVYTHSHTDHMMGFDDLRRFCELQKQSMPIYAAEDVLNDLQRVFAFAFNPALKGIPGYVQPLPIRVTGPFEIGDVTLTPVELPHGRYRVQGFILSKKCRRLVAYFTDCHELPQGAIDAAMGVETLVIDALRRRPHPTHLTVEQATHYAEQIKARRTFFTHLSHDLDHAETETSLPPTIHLAYDGLHLTIV